MIKTIPIDFTIKLNYNDNTIINVKINPTFEEKYVFAMRAAESAILRSASYSHEMINYVLADTVFDVLFFIHFTDFAFPDEAYSKDGKVDIFIAHDIISPYKIRENLRDLGDVFINALMDQLEKDFASRLDNFEQHRIAKYGRSEATEETLENINTLVNKGIETLNVALDKLNAVEPKSLTKVVDKAIKSLTKIMDESGNAPVAEKPKKQINRKTTPSVVK